MGFIIAALIVVGLILMIVEIIFIPGTTIVGIFGIIFAVAGVYFSFKEYGSTVGLYTLIGSAFTGSVLLVWSLRSGAWKRFSLGDTMQGKANESVGGKLAIGDEGMTTSALRPMGSAEFKDKRFEVRSNGEYLASGTRVRVLRITDNEIIVEPINI